jgi:hypothetical protein
MAVNNSSSTSALLTSPSLPPLKLQRASSLSAVTSWLGRFPIPLQCMIASWLPISDYVRFRRCSQWNYTLTTSFPESLPLIHCYHMIHTLPIWAMEAILIRIASFRPCALAIYDIKCLDRPLKRRLRSSTSSSSSSSQLPSLTVRNMWSALTRLDVAAARHITRYDVTILEQLPALRHLSLLPPVWMDERNNHNGIVSLASLTQLRSLRIWLPIQYISNLPSSLTRLELIQCEWSAALLAAAAGDDVDASSNQDKKEPELYLVSFLKRMSRLRHLSVGLPPDSSTELALLATQSNLTSYDQILDSGSDHDRRDYNALCQTAALPIRLIYARHLSVTFGSESSVVEDLDAFLQQPLSCIQTVNILCPSLTSLSVKFEQDLCSKNDEWIARELSSLLMLPRRLHLGLSICNLSSHEQLTTLSSTLPSLASTSTPPSSLSSISPTTMPTSSPSLISTPSLSSLPLLARVVNHHMLRSLSITLQASIDIKTHLRFDTHLSSIPLPHLTYLSLSWNTRLGGGVIRDIDDPIHIIINDRFRMATKWHRLKQMIVIPSNRYLPGGFTTGLQSFILSLPYDGCQDNMSVRGHIDTIMGWINTGLPCHSATLFSHRAVYDPLLIEYIRSRLHKDGILHILGRSWSVPRQQLVPRTSLINTAPLPLHV